MALAAGVALALVLSGDDDGKKSAASEPTTATETVTTEKTATSRTETVTTDLTQAQQDEQEVEQTVTTFVESSEQSDSRRACSQVAGGAGKQLQDCAAAVGINLRELPSSDELQIDDVNVSGDSAKATLSNGSSFSLERSGGKWEITGFQPRRQAGG